MRTIVCLLGIIFFTPSAWAILQIEITEGIADAEPIAVVPFDWRAGSPRPDIADVSAIVAADLQRSGYFVPFPEKDMLAKPTQPAQIRFQNWRLVDVPYLVIGSITPQPGDRFVVEFRLFDVFRARQMIGFRMPPVTRDQLRMTSHQVADAVYEAITGEKGAFATRLAYIKKLPKASRDPKRYLLFVADADTEGELPIMTSKAPLMSPNWSPDNSKLAFSVVHRTGQAVWTFDLNSRKPVRMTPRGQQFGAPVWSPDGKKLAVVKISNGSSDIYVLDTETRRLRRITRHWAIDTEPTWSPDGRSLVFLSDRGGRRGQLYQYFFASRKLKRLTFEGKQNLRPSFSPDGRMVTFVHINDEGKHHIAVLELESGRMEVLTRPSQQEMWRESPSFSPNGAMIIYSAIWNNKRVLAVVSKDGRIHQRFSAPPSGVEVYEPSWSGFLN